MKFLARPLLLVAALGGAAAAGAWAQAASGTAEHTGASAAAAAPVVEPPPVSTGHRALDRWLDAKLAPAGASKPRPPGSAALSAGAAPASASGGRGEPPPAILQASPQTILESQPETLREALQREAAAFAAAQRRAQEVTLPTSDDQPDAPGDSEGTARPADGATVVSSLRPVLLTVRENRYTVLAGVLLLAFIVVLRTSLRGRRRRSRGHGERRTGARSSERTGGRLPAHAGSTGGRRRTGSHRRRRL